MTTYTVRHQGYTSEVRTVTDSNAAGLDLIGMGFTCVRQTYGPDDSITGSYYRHKVNTEWTAEIVAEPTLCDLYRAWCCTAWCCTAWCCTPGVVGSPLTAARQAFLARLRVVKAAWRAAQ
jgi:hypothetical protein